MKTLLTGLLLTLWSLASVVGAQDADAFYKGVQAYRARDYVLAASRIGILNAVFSQRAL